MRTNYDARLDELQRAIPRSGGWERLLQLHMEQSRFLPLAKPWWDGVPWELREVVLRAAHELDAVDGLPVDETSFLSMLYEAARKYPQGMSGIIHDDL